MDEDMEAMEAMEAMALEIMMAEMAAADAEVATEAAAPDSAAEAPTAMDGPQTTKEVPTRAPVLCEPQEYPRTEPSCRSQAMDDLQVMMDFLPQASKEELAATEERNRREELARQELLRESRLHDLKKDEDDGEGEGEGEGEGKGEGRKSRKKKVYTSKKNVMIEAERNKVVEEQRGAADFMLAMLNLDHKSGNLGAKSFPVADRQSGRKPKRSVQQQQQPQQRQGGGSQIAQESLSQPAPTQHTQAETQADSEPMEVPQTPEAELTSSAYLVHEEDEEDEDDDEDESVESEDDEEVAEKLEDRLKLKGTPREGGTGEELYGEVTCVLCNSGEDEDKILLCDYCDLAFHMYCIIDPLEEVPEGHWYCDDCADLIDAEARRARQKEKNDRPAKQYAADAETFPCEHCDKVYYAKAALTRHLNMYTCRPNPNAKKTTVKPLVGEWQVMEGTFRGGDRGRRAPKSERTAAEGDGQTASGYGYAYWDAAEADLLLIPGTPELVSEWLNPTALYTGASRAEFSMFENLWTSAPHYSLPGAATQSAQAQTAVMVQIPPECTDQVRAAVAVDYFAWASQFPSQADPAGHTCAPATGIELEPLFLDNLHGRSSAHQQQPTTQTESATPSQAMTDLEVMMEFLPAACKKKLQGHSVMQRKTPDTGAPMTAPIIRLQPLEAHSTLSFPGEGAETEAQRCLTASDEVCLNAGGPVTCTAFAPGLDCAGVQGSVQDSYLAVGLARLGEDMTVADKTNRTTGFGPAWPASEWKRSIGATSAFPNVVQLWRVPVVVAATGPHEAFGNSDTTAAAARPVLEYCVGLPTCGDVVDVVWSPFPLHFGNGPSSDFLGILAVLGGSGECSLLLMPKKAMAAAPGSDSDSRASPSPSPSTIVHVPLLRAEDITVCTVRQAKRFDYATRRPGTESVPISAIDWSPLTPMSLVGGLADGNACLWQLSTAAWGSGAVEAKHAWAVYQDTSFIHEESVCPAVTRVKMSPVDPALLLVGDSLGHVRVWNVHKEDAPECHFKFHNGPITALDWDACGQGFFHGCAENTDVCFEYLWDQPITLSRNVATDLKRTFYSHGHDHGAVWAVRAFHHGGVSGVVSVASDGSVRIAPSISLFNPKRPFVLPVGELFRLQGVQLQPSVLSVPSVPSSSSSSDSSGRMAAEGNAEEKTGATEARDWVRYSACTSRSRLWACEAAVRGVTDPARALRALSVAAVSGLGTRGGSQAQAATAGAAVPVTDSNLVAYSGASGLVRIQTF